jgi:hypothetical protein
MYGHKSFLRLGTLDDASIQGLYKESYELSGCDFGFEQGVNVDGKAQSDVRGGNINATIAGIPPEAIIQWALSSRKHHNGAVVICDSNDTPLEKVAFRDGVCTGMEIAYEQNGKGYISTRLSISTRKLSVGEMELNNRWTGYKN